MDSYPRLRPLDFQPITHHGEQMWLLRDPLQLSDMQLIMPAALAQMLPYFDGEKSLSDIHQAWQERIHARTSLRLVQDTVKQLDDALLLENDRSRAGRAALLETYRSQPFRPASLAGLSYPDDAQGLNIFLEGFGEADDLAPGPSWRGRGIVSPHIDYERGGHVYARVWRHAQAAVAEADVVIILGTDHSGGSGTLTLTGLPYATPYGVLPGDPDLVERLATALGRPQAFADELHHRNEHSVELSAVWLHHAARRVGITPPPVVPVLVGSFQHFLRNGAHPAKDESFNAMLDVLAREGERRRLLIVSSVDLAHVGPNFGDDFTMDDGRRDVLRGSDAGLISAAVHGDADEWYDQIAAVEDRNRICGFSPTYLMLRHLGPSQGKSLAYDQCAADPQNHSLVSICGLVID